MLVCSVMRRRHGSIFICHVSMPTLPVKQFDVVIVYDKAIAEGASDGTFRGRTPFSRTGKYFSYNESYQYFLTYCKRIGLKAGFASTGDIGPDGIFTAVWVYDKKWKRLKQSVTASVVFDKFSNHETVNAAYDARLKKNSGRNRYFHNQKIRALFDDKLKTYNLLSAFAIPTVQIDVESKEAVNAAKSRLGIQTDEHTHTTDFTETYVLKDQFGAGGIDVHKVRATSEFVAIGRADTSVSYIAQPMIVADGFTFVEHEGFVDLRVIICNGDITDCYIRIAKPGEFRANAHRGGTVEYVDLKDIPKGVTAMSKAVNALLPVQDGFYALDFIKSSAGNLYLIEGNITPGLNWYNTKDEKQAKSLMRNIVDKIKVVTVAA